VGKATILSHKGNGLYNVRIEKDLSGYDRNIATSNARDTELDTVEIPALTTAENDAEIAYANSLTDLDNAIDTYNASEKGPDDKQTLAEQRIATNEALMTWDFARRDLRNAITEQQAVRAYNQLQDQKRAAAVTGEVRDVWCADFTTNLAVSAEVGIFDIPNETFNNKKAAPGQAVKSNTALAIIRPAVFTTNNEVYSAARDGIEQMTDAAPPSGAQTFWNWAVKPAWVIGKPTARIAEILSVDHGNNKADVRVLNIDSWVRNFQTKPFGEEADIEFGIYRNVDVEYMNCNARVFSEGDRVVVEFEGQSEVVGASTGPRVVGFEMMPRECTSDGFNYTAFNIAGPYRILNDVGGGWVVSSSGTPTVVDGNIDVQTHGQSRTTGGLVPDPIRFNGPYRRHIAQMMDETINPPQTILWDSQWYSERVIEGRAPGKIFGIGSQDDAGGDEVFVIAALDESTVGGSEEPPNTVGFYRRSYAGTEGVYDANTNPNGWRKIGAKTFDPNVYEAHDLPFFFNSAGTECVHVRYRKPVAATGTFQARTAKGDNSAAPAFSNLTKPKMFGTELWKFTFALDYVTAVVEEVQVENEMLDMQLTRTEDVTPKDTFSPQTTMEQSGTYVIAAEYLDDIVTVARYSVDMKEVYKVVSGFNGGSPWGHSGEWFYDATIDNKIVFERYGVTGTALAQVGDETSRHLRDTTAGFLANGITVGMEIENLTQLFNGAPRKGTIIQIVDDNVIVTSAMLGVGEVEQTMPQISSQGWSASDNFRINTNSDKEIPITQLDWHQKCIYDTLGATTLDGVSFSSFQTGAEQGTRKWTQQHNGTMKWFQAQIGYLDPRYGTALLRVHRIDGGEPFSDTTMTMGPGPSGVFKNSGGASFQAGTGITGVDSEYFAVYTNWGEHGRLEWGPLVQENGKITATEYNFPFTNALPSTVYTTFHTPIGFYDLWGYFIPEAYHYDQGSSTIWPYESGEEGEPNDNRPFMTHPSIMYQGQYLLFKNSLAFEQDRDWPLLPPWNPGWQEWKENTDPIDKIFSYYYTGTPNQWTQSTLNGNTEHDMNTDADPPVAWNAFGPFNRNGVRSFTANMQGFTTEPMPVMPMIGHCATTDGFDVFFSGFLFEPVVFPDPDGGFQEVIFVERYAFLSGEGSNLLALRTLLGGTPDQWFPLGVGQRN
jgi:hypothetical protein